MHACFRAVQGTKIHLIDRWNNANKILVWTLADLVAGSDVFIEVSCEGVKSVVRLDEEENGVRRYEWCQVSD